MPSPFTLSALAGLLASQAVASADLPAPTYMWKREWSLPSKRDGSANVLSMPMEKRVESASNSHLAARSFEAPVYSEDVIAYVVNVSFGTPPQPLSLQLDTGSSDIWAFYNGVCEKNLQYGNNRVCRGGSYDPDNSSTSEQLTNNRTFLIKYGDGSGVQGPYFTDVVAVGGQSVSNMTIGVATASTTNINEGILGVGFPANEAGAARGSYLEYPTFLDKLVAAGTIKSRVISLWLDVFGGKTGNVLFGGIDLAKFTGDLLALPIVPDFFNSNRGTNYSYSVALTSIGVSLPSGDKVLPDSFLPATALLDSGTTLLSVPQDIFNELFELFNIQNNPQQGFLTPCNIQPSQGSLNFQFGGDLNHTIAVPFSSLVLPLVDNYHNAQVTYDDGTPACQFAVKPVERGGEDNLILGDTFLRHAYVVHNQDARMIGLAQAKINATDSHIIEVDAAAASSGIPSAATTATNNAIPSSHFVQTPTVTRSLAASSSARATGASSSISIPTAITLGPKPTPTTSITLTGVATSYDKAAATAATAGVSSQTSSGAAAALQTSGVGSMAGMVGAAAIGLFAMA